MVRAAPFGAVVQPPAALGLAISTAIPNAHAAGAITNGTFVPLAILSGTFSYDLRLPGWLDTITSALPVKPFTEALRAGYLGGFPASELLVLALWAAIGAGIALRRFRWQ